MDKQQLFKTWVAEAAKGASEIHAALSDMGHDMEKVVMVDVEQAAATNSLDVKFFEDIVALKHLDEKFLRDAT